MRQRLFNSRHLRLVTAVLVAVTFTSLVPAAVRADSDAGAWIWSETRLALHNGSPSFPRTQLRLWTDTRFMGNADGLAQQFLRVGPLVHVMPWLFVGVHGTVYADRLATGQFAQEVRVELEPNFHGRLGDFTVNDRNRLEYRWRDTEARWRYRNQLRVNYAPEGSAWIPFIWDEVLIDLSGLGFNQNRLMGGVGWAFAKGTRVDVGYMLRSAKAVDAWNHDHIGVLYLFIER